MYFLSAYLDAVCYDWDALIYGDYEVVMPIPHSIFMLFVRRYDIPLFIQQLGIIGLKENQGDLKNEFIQKSQNLFRGYFCSFCFEIYSINHPFFESDIYSVWKADEPLAVCLAPRFQDRITLLIPRSNDEGLSMNAMAFLIDQIIQRNTGSNVVLDFEGSMLPGVAQFYSGFGALDRKYSILQRS